MAQTPSDRVLRVVIVGHVEGAVVPTWDKMIEATTPKASLPNNKKTKKDRKNKLWKEKRRTCSAKEGVCAELLHRADDRAKTTGIEKVHLAQIEDDARGGCIRQLTYLILELDGNGGVDPFFVDRDNQTIPVL